MSSRLAKSTSKFRPVKPQQKKAASNAPSSSQPTPAASPAPANASADAVPGLLSTVADSEADNHAATPIAATATSIPEVSSASNTLLPPTQASTPIRRSATPILLTAPSGPPTISSATSSQQPRAIPLVATTSSVSVTPRDEYPPETSATLKAPTVSTSRQGTPISSSQPKNSFLSQSWQDLEATQVATPSSTPIPDTQQTVVPDTAPEAFDKDRGKSVSPNLEPTAGDSGANKQATLESGRVERTAAPASSAISISEPSQPTETRYSSTDLQSSAPPPSLSPLPPAFVSEGERNEQVNTEEARQEQDIHNTAITREETTEADATPEASQKGKKRGRPSDKWPDAAKAKKATPRPSKRRKTVVGEGAELGSNDQADNVDENETNNELHDAEDNADVRNVISRAIAIAEAQPQSPGSREGTSADDDMSGEEAGEAASNTQRNKPAKRKAPAKAKKKKKKRRLDNAAVPGGGGDSDVEYDEDGNVVPIPWEIKKIRPGYSLSTEDIYAAVGVKPPESFEFMTGQDAFDFDEQEEENEDQRGDDDGMMQQEDEDAEQPQYDDGEAAGEEAAAGTTHWLPFSGPIDPTTTTMKQLTEDTGRGRFATKGSTSLSEKITRKQKLRLARERMKLRSRLLRQGVKAEAIDRVLDEKMEELMNGSVVVEFSHGDQSVAFGSTDPATGGHALSRLSEQQDASRHGTPSAGPSENQPLFRPDENSDDEHAQSRQQEQDEDGDSNMEQEQQEEGFDDIVESRYAPQMRLVNGEYVLDESSTQIIRDFAERDAYATVEDNPDGRKINSYTWSKRGKASRWTLADTDLFYEGLAQFGTDFELISRMFSNRTRRQIKAKFVREEKLDFERIEEALSGKKKIDITFYERMTQLDFRNGIVPADPMAKFYEDLPTLSNAAKLESNREPEPEQEIDLVALLRKKKEESAGLGQQWDKSKSGAYHGGAEGTIPEEEEQEEETGEPDTYEGEDAPDDQNGEEERASERETSYRSLSPAEEEEEPFVFSGGVQLRVSG